MLVMYALRENVYYIFLQIPKTYFFCIFSVYLFNIIKNPVEIVWKISKMKMCIFLPTSFIVNVLIRRFHPRSITAVTKRIALYGSVCSKPLLAFMDQIRFLFTYKTAILYYHTYEIIQCRSNNKIKTPNLRFVWNGWYL